MPRNTPPLPTDKLLDAATQRLAELKNFIDSKNSNRHRAKNGPTPGLRVQKHKNSYQYYVISKQGDSRGKYLPINQIEKAKAIAQQDYDEKIGDVLQEQIRQVARFVEQYHPGDVMQTYESLYPGRQLLVTPALLPQKQFISQWQAKTYAGLPFSEDAPEYFSNGGIRVRSKSEIIIADTLERNNIPFRYEHPVSLRRATVHPDFTCLNPRTRGEYLWEHFGLMGDPAYAHKAIVKIAEYAASGYILGKNLIATFEDSETPLSTRQVQAYIDEFLR